jgi:hypothetical protein
VRIQDSAKLSRARWVAEAAKLALEDPVEGLDRAALKLGLERRSRSRRPGPTEDADLDLHGALGLSYPCAAAAGFEPLWRSIQAELELAGLRTGRGAFGGWDDADRNFARVVWCLTTHIGSEVVVETGVARGLTTRFVLERLRSAARGRLWSIDRRPIDASLHGETGAAVPDHLRDRWTYVEGTSRKRLPGLLARVKAVDLFIHDSLHTTRNLRFELDRVWPTLRAGGAVVADDIHRNDAFGEFAEATPEARSLVIQHSDSLGCFGVLVKTTASA